MLHLLYSYVKYVKQFITWVDDQQQQQQSDNGTSNRSRFSATQMQVMEEKRRARDALSQSKRFLESL